MSENDVIDDCFKWLCWHKCFVHRNNTGAYKPDGSSRFIRYGQKGSGDIEGMTQHGRFISVECKYGKNKQTEDQIKYGERVKEHNGIYVVAYSSFDLEQIKDQL